jgi:hypothetical protein
VFDARQWGLYIAANTLIALTYALIGVLIGPLFGRVGGVLIAFLVPFLDIGIEQSPMLHPQPPAWAHALPGYGPAASSSTQPSPLPSTKPTPCSSASPGSPLSPPPQPFCSAAPPPHPADTHARTRVAPGYADLQVSRRGRRPYRHGERRLGRRT